MEEFMGYYYLFWVCIFGLCLGSFYNVVILRSLSDESIIFPPSKCPKCQNKLKHGITFLFFHIYYLEGNALIAKKKSVFNTQLLNLLQCAFLHLHILNSDLLGKLFWE